VMNSEINKKMQSENNKSLKIFVVINFVFTSY